jgi:hypothetical protein
MAKKLVIYQLRDNNRFEIGRLEGEALTLGREPGEGLAVKSQAISRQHGRFRAIKNHWFYQDLGSTNGSWLNGEKLPEKRLKLVKPQDCLQLADVALQLGEADPESGYRGMPSLGVRSLLVFSRGEFLDEYPVPEYGRALVIGGAKADLKLDVDVFELPSLVLERRGENLVAFSIAKEMPVKYNGTELSHPVTLKDRDEVAVSHYSVVYNDLPPLPAATQMQGAEGAVGTGARQLDDWESVAPSARLSEKLPFGRSLRESESLDSDETVAIDEEKMAAELNRYDLHPSRRYSLPEDGGSAFDALEDKIVLLIGILMLMALVGVVAWWVLK